MGGCVTTFCLGRDNATLPYFLVTVGWTLGVKGATLIRYPWPDSAWRFVFGDHPAVILLRASFCDVESTWSSAAYSPQGLECFRPSG